MEKTYVILVLILLFTCFYSPSQYTKCTENDSVVIYCAEVLHYWAVDFALIKQPFTLSSPSLDDPHQLIIDASYREELYDDIIGYIPEYEERLCAAGLNTPKRRDGSLFFEFVEKPSHYIEYNGKILLIKTAVSGKLLLKDLGEIDLSLDDLYMKIDITRELVVRAIHERFQSEIFELHKYAPHKQWMIKRFDIFTEYIVDIKKTNIDHTKIDHKLHEYLYNISRESGLEIYPTDFENQDHIELRRRTSGYSTNIIIHDGKYKPRVEERDDEFDMYIMLKQIERICRQSLDILETLKSVPDEKEEDFLSDFEEKWKILRDIQAFMSISTMYIEKHNATLEAERGGKRWMIENLYQNQHSIVEALIIEAKSKALSYDMRYLTEKDLFLMKKALSQYENAETLLTKTKEMLELNEILLILTMILVVLGIVTLLSSTRRLDNIKLHDLIGKIRKGLNTPENYLYQIEKNIRNFIISIFHYLFD